MPEPLHEKGQEIFDLVSTALSQDRRSGLTEMLRSVAQTVGANGCILWQQTPFSRLADYPPTGQFFVLAEWFEGPERSYLHDLSLHSVTGEAILSQEPLRIDDAKNDPRVDRRDPFFNEVGIHCFCSVPITFLDGEKGALNAYRTLPLPFRDEEITTLDRIVRLLPDLYQTIIDKVSFQLVRTVNGILQKAEVESLRSDVATEHFEKIADKICHEIADSLQALEVSIFLEDSLKYPGSYNLMATTWPANEPFTKKRYRADPEEGLTGWVLRHHQEIRIFNFSNFKAEQKQLHELYPGLQWKDSLHVATSVPRILKVQKGAKLQPLSFLAVPIKVSDRLFGALRCCTIKEGPFYFAQQEIKLLQLVAAQIGQAWSHWLSRREIEEENSALQRFVASISELNRFVEHQVDKAKPDEKEIFHRALQATRSVIQNAEITDVRLLDEASQELYFEATYGAAWESGTPEEVRARKARRFPVSGDPPTSGGAYVVQTKKVYVITDTSDPKHYYLETFPETRRVIGVPIGIAREIFGVLDIRGTGEREFPKHAVPIAELLGQQLGLYHYLLKTIGELQDLQRSQAQTFEDFTHQLKSPILQLHARARAALQLGSAQTVDTLMQRQLLALRGLAAKAKRATQNLRLFADLTRAQALAPQLKQLKEGLLVKMLIESTIDQRSLLQSSRAIFFYVADKTFETLHRYSVKVDPDLLFHAANNLLDNAAKYSYNRTTVRVEGGITGTDRFHISVTNTGLSITPAEAERCKERGWRSESAKGVTGEGSGIGLWIVDNIMKAHGGELKVTPTTPDNLTEVRLIFPIERARRQEFGR